jgi:hypothetical protein
MARRLGGSAARRLDGSTARRLDGSTARRLDGSTGAGRYHRPQEVKLLSRTATASHPHVRPDAEASQIAGDDVATLLRLPKTIPSPAARRPIRTPQPDILRRLVSGPPHQGTRSLAGGRV